MAGDQVKGSFKHLLGFLVVKPIMVVLRILPFRWRSAFGGWLLRGPIGKIIKYRKRVYNNLDMALPELTAEERESIANATLDNAGRTIIENWYPHSLDKNAKVTKFFGEGVEEVWAAYNSGRPIQFVSGHFGNHEVFRLEMFRRGMPVGGLYRPLSNPYINKIYAETMQLAGKAGPTFPTVRKGTARYRRTLREGNVALILLIDLAVSRGTAIEFFGKPAYTATSAAAFALEADALYVPYFSMRKGDGFELEIAKPIPASDALTMTTAATQVLEDRIRQDPGNWFWVHRRWKKYNN